MRRPHQPRFGAAVSSAVLDTTGAETGAGADDRAVTGSRTVEPRRGLSVSGALAGLASVVISCGGRGGALAA